MGKIKKLIVIGLAVLATQLCVAKETVFNHTFDKCEKNKAGRISICHRGNDLWVLPSSRSTVFIAMGLDKKPNRAWVCRSFKSAPNKRYQSIRTIYEFNCLNKSACITSIKAFSGQFCEGKVTDSIDFAAGEKNARLSPKSILGIAYSSICKK